MNKQQIKAGSGQFRLIDAKVGSQVFIECTGNGDNTLVAIPNPSDEIDALGTGNSLTINAGEAITLDCAESNKWTSS